MRSALNFSVFILSILTVSFFPTIVLSQNITEINKSGSIIIYSKTYDKDSIGCQSIESNAKTNKKNDLWWFSAGFGMPSLGINLSINHTINKVLISGDFIHVAKFNDNDFWGGVDKDCYSYSFLLGAYKTDKNIFSSISSGVSYIVGLDRPESEAYTPGVESIKFKTIGLPIKVQLSLNGKYVGLGVYGIFNLNKNMPYGIGVLSLSLGNMK